MQLPLGEGERGAGAARTLSSRASKSACFIGALHELVGRRSFVESSCLVVGRQERVVKQTVMSRHE